MTIAALAQAKAPAWSPSAAAPPLAQRRMAQAFAPPLASLAAIPARPIVQRTCEACGDEEKDEQAVQPRLEIGSPADPLEAEADAIAARVIAQEPVDASDSPAAVQRACAACASTPDEPHLRREGGEETEKEEEEKDLRVAPRRASLQPGGETIHATEAELIAGGGALPATTRTFFETRMGRDLSGVRIHQGSAAQGLNRSIAARAFTYRNHIWLGSGESASPSFTLAHELAHVMQQTAPGPVGPAEAPVSRSRAAAPSVQRTYFYEEQGKSLPETHDEVVTELTSKDHSLFGEVPVPNANRKGFQLTKKRFGRADLASFAGSKFQVPVGMSTARCPTGDQNNWYCSSGAMRSSSRKPTTLDEGFIGTKQSIIHQGAAWGRHEAESVPRFGRFLTARPMMGFVRDAGGEEKAAFPIEPNPSDTVPEPATTMVGLADVKAGAFASARRKALAQLRNYMLGFKEAHEGYEDVRLSVEDRRREMRAAGRNDFSSLPPALTPWKMEADLLGSINGIGPVAKLFAGRTIILKKWKSDDEGGIAGSETVPGAQPERGNLFFWKDTGALSGAWSYLWTPEASEGTRLFDALGPDPDFEKLKKESHCIRETLLLPASPPKPGSAPAKPLAASAAPACLKTLRISRAPAPLVRRAPPAKADKPKPPPDPFKENYKDFEKKQKELTTDFGKYGKSSGGRARQSALAELEARDNIARQVPGQSGALSAKGADKLKEQGSDFYWMEAFEGRSGWLIGQLRLRFGSLFEKIVSAYATVKEKVTAFFAKLSPSKAGKGIAKAVLKIVVKILGAVGNWVLPRVQDALMACLEEGISNKIEELFSDGPLAVVREKVDQAKAFAAQLTESVLGGLTSIGDMLVGDIRGTIEKIKEAASFISKIVNLGKEVFDLVRLAICAAGGAESFGLSCAVSLVDKLLSLLGISPLELLAESLLSTCMGQNLLAKGMMAIQAVQNLPRTIAARIIDTIKPRLPEAAQGLLCDTGKMKLELPDLKDVTCGSGGSPAAAPGPDADGKYSKGSWVPPVGYPDEKTRKKLEQLANDNAPAAPAAPPPPETPAAPPVENKPATPTPGTDPAPGDGGTVQPVDSVAEDRLANAAASRATLQIRGQGFNPNHKYDGTIYYSAKLVARDNSGRIYGPVPVEIYVFGVTAAGTGWTIDFTFHLADKTKNIVLTDGETGSKLEIYDSATKRITAPLGGSDAPAASPAAVPGGKK
jgi:hypothetical protein